MQGKLLFLAGAGVGYVFGARAGRERYEAMKTQADTLWHDPRVQEKVDQASAKIQEKAPQVQAKVADVASQATAAVKDKTPDLQSKVADVASAAKEKVGKADPVAAVKNKVGSGQDTEVTKANVTTNDHPGHGYPPEGALP